MLAILTLPSLVSAQDKEGIEFEKNALELSFDFVDGDVKRVIGRNFGIDFRTAIRTAADFDFCVSRQLLYIDYRIFGKLI